MGSRNLSPPIFAMSAPKGAKRFNALRYDVQIASRYTVGVKMLYSKFGKPAARRHPKVLN